MAIFQQGFRRLVVKTVIFAALYLNTVCLGHGFDVTCHGGEAIVGGTATLSCKYERNYATPPFLVYWKKRHVSDVVKYSVRRRTDQIQDPWRGRLTHLFQDDGTSGVSTITIHNVTIDDAGEYVLYVHLRGIATSGVSANITVIEVKSTPIDNIAIPVGNTTSGCDVSPDSENTQNSCGFWKSLAIAAFCIIIILAVVMIYLLYKLYKICTKSRRCACRIQGITVDGGPSSGPDAGLLSNGSVSNGVLNAGKRQRSNMQNTCNDDDNRSSASDTLVDLKNKLSTRLQRIANIVAILQNKVNDLQVQLQFATAKPHQERSQSTENTHRKLTDIRNELTIAQDQIKRTILDATKYEKTPASESQKRIIDDITKNLTNLENQTLNLENEAIQFTMSLATDLNKGEQQREIAKYDNRSRRTHVGIDSPNEEAITVKIVHRSGQQKRVSSKNVIDNSEVRRNENTPKQTIPGFPQSFGLNNGNYIPEDLLGQFREKPPSLPKKETMQTLFKLAMHPKEKLRLANAVHKGGGIFRYGLLPKACHMCASAA